MKTILITGASGFIGTHAAKEFARDHHPILLSRKQPDAPGKWYKGSFELFEDLRQLDAHQIDALVHLGAVTGGCSEEDGMAVNVQGTRRLLRYLIDRGTRRFVLASSIATVGLLDNRFLPLQLPIPDDHPCLAFDFYGLSKYLMEEETRYFARQYTDADFVNFRIGAVVPADWSPKDVTAQNPPTWSPPCLLSNVCVVDVVAAIRAALTGSPKPGVRVLNLVAPTATADDPVPAILRASFDSRWKSYDLSHYEKPGHEYDPIFSIANLKKELGFTPQIPVRPREFRAWKAKQSS